MIPGQFEYHLASDLSDASTFIQSHDNARVIAGGQSLLPLMKLRIASPGYLVDIGRIKDLKYINVDQEGVVRIGALTTHLDVEESALLNDRCPVLPSVAREIADVQVRSRGTVGGSIAHADPSGDYFPALFVMNASVVLFGVKGTRSVKVEDFIQQPLTTSLERGEILSEIVIPASKGRVEFKKFSRRQGDFAIVNAAARIHVVKGLVKEASVAVGAASSIPVRLKGLEKQLVDKQIPAEGDLTHLVTEAVNDLDPPSDIHGSAWYRKRAAGIVLNRILSTILYGGEGQSEVS